MYKANRIGPWPIIDTSADKVLRNETEYGSNYGGALNVCLDTANLGSQKEAFVNCYYDGLNNAGLTFGVGKRVFSFGVLLSPISSITLQDDIPVMVDISMAATIGYSATAYPGFDVIPFIGFIDDGLSPTDGFDATNNLVTNYNIICGNTQGAKNLDLNYQILLKNVVSGANILGQYLCIGFMISQARESTITSVGHVDYHISARYALKSVPTIYLDA